jgi:hypothetical protein
MIESGAVIALKDLKELLPPPPDDEELPLPPEDDIIEQLDGDTPVVAVIEKGPCFATMLLTIYNPQNGTVILSSGIPGSGKTHSAVELMFYIVNNLPHHYIITNILFSKKVGEDEDDWMDEEEPTAPGTRGKPIQPHDNIYPVRNMIELWLAYAKIRRKDKKAVILPIFDEIQKFIDRTTWWADAEKAFKNWFSENRKFHTVPVLICQHMSFIPTRSLADVRWYFAKSAKLTRELNAKEGTRYNYQQLLFIIKIEPEHQIEKLKEDNFYLVPDVQDYILLERSPWTAIRDEAQIGDICYDAESSTYFEMGELNENEKWFPDFMKAISGPRYHLADRIEAFFEEAEVAPIPQDKRLNIMESLFWMLRNDESVKISEEGNPMLPVRVKGQKKVQWAEISPTFLARLGLTSERSLRHRIQIRWQRMTTEKGRETIDAKETGASQEP